MIYLSKPLYYNQTKCCVSWWLWYQNGWSTQSHNSKTLITLIAVMAFMFISGTHNFCSICFRLLYHDIHHIFRVVICHVHCQLLHCDTLMCVAIPEAAANPLPSSFHTSKCLVKTLDTSMVLGKKSAWHYQCLLWQLGKCCPHTLHCSWCILGENKTLVGEKCNWE